MPLPEPLGPSIVMTWASITGFFQHFAHIPGTPQQFNAGSFIIVPQRVYQRPQIAEESLTSIEQRILIHAEYTPPQLRVSCGNAREITKAATRKIQLALFDLRAQEEVWGEDSSVLVSSSYAPTGKVEAVEGVISNQIAADPFLLWPVAQRLPYHV